MLALLSIEQLMAARAKSEEGIRRKLTCGEMCIPLFAQADQQIQLRQQRDTNCEVVYCATTLHDKPDNRCHWRGAIGCCLHSEIVLVMVDERVQQP